MLRDDTNPWLLTFIIFGGHPYDQSHGLLVVDVMIEVMNHWWSTL